MSSEMPEEDGSGCNRTGNPVCQLPLSGISGASWLKRGNKKSAGMPVPAYSFRYRKRTFQPWTRIFHFRGGNLHCFWEASDQKLRMLSSAIGVPRMGTGKMVDRAIR